ncbi:hypothetical protein BC834DRAFT_875036 [Gloeopeniophorella convolvens]|nr:hypothetical protein BC834DRAFT_875036 [Gloeopeniophorella convolvens]
MSNHVYLGYIGDSTPACTSFMDPESAENIFNDALVLLGEDSSSESDNALLSFGPLNVTVAPKEGKAITLLADHLFSPALLLAERIERGLIPLSGYSVIELGSGTALPSLLASTLPDPPALVVVTDYPDDIILGNLKSNVDSNAGAVTSGCAVRCEGYEWGQDASHLLKSLAPQGPLPLPGGYDAVILSDLLHFDRSHGALLDSISMLLARRPTSRVFVAAGIYTRTDVCTAFLHQAEKRGLLWIDSGAGENGREVDEEWRGTLPIHGVDWDQLGVRKGMCRWWVGRWSDKHL